MSIAVKPGSASIEADPGEAPPAVPEDLQSFDLRRWYAPELDPPPPPNVRYDTRDDRYVYHFVKAVRRYQAARDAA